jgi:hypothetical protein
MYHQINIQQFHVLPTHCIYLFCVDLRKKQRLFPYTALSVQVRAVDQKQLESFEMWCW